MESIAMLYIDFSLLLQNSVGHRNHPLNHFGSFVLWMSEYYGGRCSRPFKNHRPQSRTTDRTCPYLAESVFRAISDHSVNKRAYLAHCDLTFVVLLVLLKKGCLKALTTFARTSQILISHPPRISMGLLFVPSKQVEFANNDIIANRSIR